MKDCLVIACSPFQIICALEAISYFEVENFDFILPLTGRNQKTNSECKEILDGRYIEFNEFRFSSLKEQFDYFLKNTPSKYKQIICGDYMDLNQRLLIHLSSASDSRIIFVDDGNSSLKVLENRFSFWKHLKVLGKIKLCLINTIHKPKKSNITFFSIFNFPLNKQVIKNNLSSLRYKTEKDQKGIYILGTVTSIFNPILENSSIEIYLGKLILYFKEKYPKEKIFYCPHRRDKNNENINSIIKQNQVTLFDTKVSVEADFIKQQINPLIVVGFGSTALFTLKTIYTDSMVLSITLITTDKELNEEYKLIEKKYSEIGIEILNLN